MLEGYLLEHVGTIFGRFRDNSKGFLSTVGSLVVLQELAVIEGAQYFSKILEELETNKLYFKAIAELLSNPQTNKL